MWQRRVDLAIFLSEGSDSLIWLDLPRLFWSQFR